MPQYQRLARRKPPPTRPSPMPTSPTGSDPTTATKLISRILHAPDDLSSFTTFMGHSEIQEIGQYLRALHGSSTDPYGVFTNHTCGFHVQVARIPSPDSNSVLFPLPVLQHLAYLLVQYEDLITHLHPPPVAPSP